MQAKTLGACVALTLASFPAHAAGECTVGKYAEIPVTMTGTRPIITGSVNGMDAHFLVDSGAFYSVLWRESADKFKLTLRAIPWLPYIEGVGGSRNVSQATVTDFSLAGWGGGAIHDVNFMITGADFASGADGVIGQNILGFADAEYDLANGAIRLFRAKGCEDMSFAYWHGTEPVTMIDLENLSVRSPHLVGRATLNGFAIHVVFDTGASRSMLTLKAASRAGFKRDNPGVVSGGLARGIGPKEVATWIARFDLLDLGGEQIKHAWLRVGDFNLPDGADMLLGADFFLSHRLYVSNSQHRIYLTYNGGKVFDLSVQGATASDAPAAPDSPGVTASAAARYDEPTDAAGFRRRGAASAGRGDLRSALADLDEAVKRDPHDAENYYQRGLARSQNRQPVLAMSDMDQALQISPGHVEALAMRGALRLQHGDEAGAGADFAAAISASPANSDLSLNIALSYDRYGYHAKAIERLDQWIAAHPGDDRLLVALNGRCWARAMIGKDLNLALEDCSAALGKDPHNPRVLDSRGMVSLQLGDWVHAISDYEASLATQPKNPWSLYGLGLAELRKGEKEKGNQHLQAALAADPQIAAQFNKLGLEP